jgi:polysaccharide biosynthesis transport protein
MAVETPTLNAGAGMRGTGAALSLSHSLAAVRRRLRPMLIAAGVVALAAFLAAFLWPPTYRSTGTILIEQQEIPTDFVRSAVTSYADQRVQVISQRVMTSSNLISIIEKYKLYPDIRDTATRERLVDTARNDIELKMISADVVDPRQGRATKATIAFSVSYDNRNPQMAARVANELTSLYLSENIETRKQLAADTAGFLRSEAERVGKRVSEIAQQVADFKAKNSDKLPELYQVNMQMLDRGEQELRNTEARVQSLDQQLLFLDAQLAQINPTSAVFTESGERVLSSQDRLKILRSQYASATVLYTPDHPTVLRLKHSIASLEAQLGADGGGDARNDIARALTAARGELDVASQRYSPDHPDVKRLQQTVAGLEADLRKTASVPVTTAGSSDAPDNPTYIAIRTQREAALNERSSLLAQSAATRARIGEIERRQSQAPTVERDYSALQRDLQGERSKYDELRQKEMEAQLVQNLETERKGERFTLIEPPMQPQTPISPNRKLIVLLGVLLAIGAAVGMLLLLEATDTRIRDRAHVLQLLAVPPLAVIPYMEVTEEHRQRLKHRAVFWVAATAALGLAVLLVHLLVRPLDLVWYTLVQRFGA